MSVKSERRAWYAANVKPRPCADARSAEYMDWVREANAYMKRVCVPLTADLRPEFAGESAEPVSVAPVRVKSYAAPSSADRFEYDAFLDAQCLAFGLHTGAGGPSDDFWKSGVHGRIFGKGPFAHAEKYLNGDALDALERGVIRWVTFAEFKLDRAKLRAEEAVAAEELQTGHLPECDDVMCMCEWDEWAA